MGQLMRSYVLQTHRYGELSPGTVCLTETSFNSTSESPSIQSICPFLRSFKTTTFELHHERETRTTGGLTEGQSSWIIGVPGRMTGTRFLPSLLVSLFIGEDKVTASVKICATRTQWRPAKLPVSAKSNELFIMLEFA